MFCNVLFYSLSYQAMEGQWAPAVLNDQREFDFIKQAQRTLGNDKSYWIGGSTGSQAWSIISFNTYNQDSGKHTI